MRVAIYCRYSSDLQRDASIDDQIRVCRARADREGWNVTEIFTDHAISGTTLARPGYQALMARLQTREVEIVLAESLDRFSRDQEHAAAFFKQASFAGARIFTLAEGEVSELIVGLKGTMGALYIKDLSAKTHRGLVGRIQAGRCVGAPPYGYRAVRRIAENGEPERGLREIDDTQAKVVRRIFKDYAAGISPHALAKALNREGVPGPTGGIWYNTAIRGRALRDDGILRNPLYVGRLVWNRSHNTKDPINGSRVRRMNPESDRATHDVPELAIVDKTLWERVQQRLVADAVPAAADGTSNPTVHFSERRRPVHLLSRKVVCGVCGKVFSRVGKDYLACRDAQEHGCTNTLRPRQSHLQAQTLDALGQQLMLPEPAQAFAAVQPSLGGATKSEPRECRSARPRAKCRREADHQPGRRHRRRIAEPGYPEQACHLESAPR